MAGVKVDISATTDKLQAGVDEANDILDSLKSQVDSVKNSFLSLAAVTAGALSFEGLKSSFDQLATYADSVQNMQAMVGGSLESLTTLSGVASLTGVSFTGLGRSVSEAALQVEKAGKDSWTPGAQALRQLGLNSRDLVGLPVDAWLARVSDAVSRFNPSAQLTANVTAAFGRGFADLMPLLIQGGDSFKELEASVRKVQEGLASTLPGISETEAKLTMLKLSSQAFAAQVFTALKPAADAAIDGFAALTRSITLDDIRDTANKIANVLVDIAASVAVFMVKAGVQVDNLKTKLTSLGGFKIDLIAEGDFPGIRSALGWLSRLTGNYEKTKDILSKPLTFSVGESGTSGGGVASSVSDQLKTIEDDAQRAHDKINNIIPVSGTWLAVSQDLAHLNSEVVAAGENFTHLNAKALDLGGRSGVEAAISGINAQIAAETAAYDTQVEHINSLAKTFQISETTKTSMLSQALEQRFSDQLISIAQESEIAGLSVQQKQKMYDEYEKLEQKYDSDHRKLLDQSLQEDVKQWTSVLQPIESAWNSQLRGLLAGTTSWASAMRSMFSTLAIDAIQALEKIAVEKAAVGLANAVGGPTSLIGSAMSSLGIGTGAAGGAAQTAASTANTSALTASTAAVTADTTASTALTTIQTTLDATFTSIGATLTTAMAALTAAVTANTAADTLNSASKLIPSYDTGSWSLPSNTLATVHQGEMIIPAGPAAAFRSAWSSGGGSGGGGTSVGGAMNVNLNLSSFNPSGLQATINSMMPQLARAMARYQNLNPSTR